MANGRHCSNYRAETEALIKAFLLTIDSSEAVFTVVFLTDARSVLEALTNNKSPDLARAMNDISATCNFTSQWIPAHCEITGNEEADHLAQLGAQS